MEQRGVQVGNVMPVLDRVKAQFVGLAVSNAPLDAAARERDREAIGMMVAAVAPLCARRATKFGANDDQSFI